MTARNRSRFFHYLIITLFIINISLIAINVGIWVISARQGYFITADFTNFYTGFRLVLQGDGSHLYDLEFQSTVQQEIMGDINFTGGLLPYVNPPIIAVLFSPLALLPIHTAFYVWTLGELGLLIWMMVLLNRFFSNWKKQERLIMSVTVLAFWPLAITFLHGQFSLFILLCLLQMYIAIKNLRLINAGNWLFLLIIKPQALPIPGMLALNRRYWRITAVAMVIGIVVVILTGIVLGFPIWVRYFQVLSTMGANFGSSGFNPDFQYTFRGLLTNILGYTHARTINLISLIAFIVGTALVWMLWMRGIAQGENRFKLNFSFTILLSAFLSLHLYPHDDLILVLPALLFYDYLRESSVPIKAFSVFVLISPLVFIVAAFIDLKLFGFLRLPTVLIIIFLVWICYYLILELRKEREEKQRECVTSISSKS